MIQRPQLKPRHKEILKLLQNSWLSLCLAMGCMVVLAGTEAASAYLIKPALDDVFINKDGRMLKLIPLAVLCVYLLRSPAMYCLIVFVLKWSEYRRSTSRASSRLRMRSALNTPGPVE